MCPARTHLGHIHHAAAGEELHAAALGREVHAQALQADQGEGAGGTTFTPRFTAPCEFPSDSSQARGGALAPLFTVTGLPIGMPMLRQ